MNLTRHKFLLVIPLAVGLVGCSGSSESSRKRVLDTAKKYYDQGKYKEASLVLRRVIQKEPKYGEAYYRLGLTELKRGRPADAIHALRRASELQPENDDAHGKLGDLYLAIYFVDKKKFSQQLADVSDLAERILKRRPNNFEGLRLKGFHHLAGGETEKAVAAFNSALQVKPDRPDLILALAQAMSLNKQQSAAQAMVRQAIDRHKDFAGFYDFLYMGHARDNLPQPAEEILQLKVTNNPAKVQYRMELAGHYARMRKPDQMKAALQGILDSPKQFEKAYENVGDFYFRIGDLDSSYRTLEQGLKVQPEYQQTFRKKMVELAAILGRREEALAMGKKLVEDYKDDPEAKAIRASLRLQGADKQELDAAIQELSGVLKKMPDRAVLRYNLGEAHLKKGEVEAARAQFQEAMKLQPTYVQPKLAQARIHLAKGEFATALQLADESLRVAPGLIVGRLARASALLGSRDLRGARTELETILKSSPNTLDAQYLLAVINLNEKGFDEAEKGFMVLRQATPPDVRGLYGLSDVYAATGRHALAKQLINKELESKPAQASGLRVALANVAIRGQEYAEAVEVLQSLTREHPQAVDVWLRLGETYRLWKKTDDAIRCFEKAKQLAPGNPTPLLSLAMTLEGAGRKDQTRPLYEQVLQKQPDNPIALNNLAYILADSNGDLDQALSYAQKARQLWPNNEDVADTLGLVCIKKNLPDEAAKIFRDLLGKRPEHVTWRYHLAMALFQKGDKLEARRQLRQALQSRPKPDEKEKIDQLLARIG
jgi:tetratricopeptide (TPR) repeat protein